MEIDLQKPVSEYGAIAKMDRIVRRRSQGTRLSSLNVDDLRRREILLELTGRIIAAEDVAKKSRRIRQSFEG